MHRVLVVGNSFFADMLKQMLAASEQIEVIGVCLQLEQLPAAVLACSPDAVVVADTHGRSICTCDRQRIGNDLPIIYTSLTDDHLTIFTSRRVKAAQSQLIAAICALPDRS